MTTRHQLQPCLNCGKELDSADGLDHDATASPGDVTVCFGCHHVMIYGDGLILRAPTDEEIVEMAGDPSLINVMKALGVYKKFGDLCGSLSHTENPPRPTPAKQRASSLKYSESG